MAARPTRRAVLSGGLAGAILLAVGSALAGRDRGPPGDADLSPREREVLAALADALDPPAGDFPGAAALGTAARVEDLLRAVHPQDRREIRQAVRMLDGPLAGLLVGQGFRGFRDRTPAERRALILAWRDGRLALLRRAAIALIGLCTAATWSHPGVYAACGYPGPPDYGSGEHVPTGRWSTLADLAPLAQLPGGGR